jgi:hypothetical protein
VVDVALYSAEVSRQNFADGFLGSLTDGADG